MMGCDADGSMGIAMGEAYARGQSKRDKTASSSAQQEIAELKKLVTELQREIAEIRSYLVMD